MEKKKWVKLAGFAMLVLLSLFLCVGCAENSAEDSDEVTFIDFGRESASSRGIESWNESLYPPESLYWRYTAKKIRGNYTTGQTLAEETVLKNGPATGLGTVGPFSVGVWEFKLYGYYKCEEDTDGTLKFSDLVYTGKTGTADNGYTTTIDKRPVTTPETPMQQIIFELTANDSFSGFAKGELELKNMYLTVPEGQRFTVDSATTPVTTYIRVTVTDVTDTTHKKVAVSTTTVSAETLSGVPFDLNNFVFESAYSPVAKFDAGVRNLQFKAEYKDVFTGSADATQYASDEGWAPIGTISTYPVPFTKGVKTTLSGDINDIQVAEDGEAHNEKFYGAVAKILKAGKTGTEADAYDLYYTFAAAVAKYGDDNHKDSTDAANPIIVIHDIEDAGSFSSVPENMVVKLCDGDNRYFINNLTVGGDNNIVFKLADENRDYTFGKGKITAFSHDANNTVWLDTLNGTLDVDAAGDSVYHTGKADEVTITAVAKTDTSVKGYFLGTAKTGANPETSVSALEVKEGSLNIGGQAAIETLKVSAGSSVVTVCGRTTSHVGNIDAIRDGSSTYVTSANKDVFKTVTFNANGGTATTSSVTKYGIEGMYMNLVDNTAVSFEAPTGLVFNCWNTKAKNREGDDYSATGKIAVVKDGDGSYPVLYAVWGYHVAKIKTATADTYDYFGTLNDAVLKYGTTEYGSNPVVLLRDINTESITHSGSVKINPDKFSLKNITFTSTGTAEIDVAADRVYTFGGVAESRLDEFSYRDSDVTIKTNGTNAGNLTVNAPNDNVVHTGAVKDITITDVANDVANSKGYHLAATASGTVTLTKGFLEIDANIANLNVTSATGVSLKGRAGTNAVVTVCKFSGTQRNTWSTSGTEYAPYKQVVLNGNGGVLKVGSVSGTVSGSLYMNYVEGLKLTLPDVSTSTAPATAPSGTTFSKWNTESDSSGYDYADKAKIEVPSAALTLYACWSKPVAKMMKNGGEWGFFYTFADAALKCGTDGYATNQMILLEDIDTAGSVSPAVNTVKVIPDGHYVKNLTISAASKNIEFDIASNRAYTFYGNGAKVNEFSYEDNEVTVKTDNANTNVKVDAAPDTINHSGTVGTLDIVNAKYSGTKAAGSGYYLAADASATTVNVTSGSLDLGAGTAVDSLCVKATATGKVTLKGTTTTTVSKMFSDGTEISKGTIGTADSDLSGAYTVYKLDGNGQKVTGSTTTDICYVYGIDGMYLTLPKYEVTSARTTYADLPLTLHTAPVRSYTGYTSGSQVGFVMWSTSKFGEGTRYLDEHTFTVGTSDVTLYVGWGAPVGGTVFYIDTSGASNYKFYKVSGSTYVPFTTTIAVGTDCLGVYYIYSNTTYTGKDRYYIFNKSLIKTNTTTAPWYEWDNFNQHPASDYGTPGYGTFSSYSYNGKTYKIVASTIMSPSKAQNLALGVGQGRNNTDYILNLDKVYGTSGYTGVLYNPAGYRSTTTALTVWSTLTTLRESKPEGCGDWYIPSAGELANLATTSINKGSGAGKYGLSSTPSEYLEHCNGTIDKVVLDGTNAGNGTTSWRWWQHSNASGQVFICTRSF